MAIKYLNECAVVLNNTSGKRGKEAKELIQGALYDAAMEDLDKSLITLNKKKIAELEEAKKNGSNIDIVKKTDDLKEEKMKEILDKIPNLLKTTKTVLTNLHKKEKSDGAKSNFLGFLKIFTGYVKGGMLKSALRNILPNGIQDDFKVFDNATELAGKV